MAEMKNEKKLKLLIIGCSVLLFFMLATFASAQYSKSTKFCSSCHATAAQVESWKKSSHSTVACVKCHNTPGVFKILGDKDWAKKTVQFTTQLWQRPVKILNPVQNEVCLKCHSENRETTPSGDLIIPHDRHQEKNVRCIACHQGIVHGEKMNIEVMQQREFDSNPDHPKTPPKTNMNDCLDCHAKKQQTIACEACHTDIVKPPSHDEPTFDTEHGLQAFDDVDGCNKCHSYTFSNEGVKNEQDRVKKYARGNVFCYTCHMKTPLSHEGEWLDRHPPLAKDNKDGCLVCHSEEPKKDDRVTKTYCNTCHAQPHESGWRKIHPSKVKIEGTANRKCFDCHSQNQCYSCHTGQR